MIHPKAAAAQFLEKRSKQQKSVTGKLTASSVRFFGKCTAAQEVLSCSRRGNEKLLIDPKQYINRNVLSTFVPLIEKQEFLSKMKMMGTV